MKEVLKFEGVGLTYQTISGEVKALHDINFSVRDKELVSIIGPSGCGKTTVLSLIAGLVKPTKGQILLNGKEMKGDALGVGYMLQRDSLLDWRTIRSNTQLGLELCGKLEDNHLKNVDKLLKTYGLWDFKDKYPRELSGGMRQRVALIRTLAIKPDLLLLDEAFSALDYQTRLLVVDDVYNILRQENKSAIMVTHDIAEGISMADRVIVLSKRPGSISQDIKLDFKQDETPLERRSSSAFQSYFNDIWREFDRHE
ncbi:MAG: ABC transporter ATP-binding protein [Defluviitaleaceae bacterium]|nr:ABC transporter ATP-binding protein [Defluviitaleaceae bacterium]